MKKVIFYNWNIRRFLRLALGSTVIVQSVIAGNWGMGVLGLVFTAMPVFNIGCCQTAGCKTIATKPTESTKNIIFEEVV